MLCRSGARATILITMISKRRTSAPILVIALGMVALLLRQAQVQIREHAIWAEEAARLERSGELIPYRRGAIEDAEGRVLVRDVEAYHLDFAYREFRRGHPLAQVAHAMSVLLLEPVPLTESLEFAPIWAGQLVDLTPFDLQAFGGGDGLQIAPMVGLPATDQRLGVARDAHQRDTLDLRRRSGDLGFYLGRLLALTKAETKELLRADEDKGRQHVSYLKLVAEMRGRTPVTLRAEVVQRVTDALEDLDLLAVHMGFATSMVSERPAAALTRELETWRRGIEDATASRLFAEATGFAPGRLDPGLLMQYIELDWISVHMQWNAERLYEWAVDTRRTWLAGWRDGVVLPRLMALLRSGDVPSAREVALVLSSLWYSTSDLNATLDGEVLELSAREDLAMVKGFRQMLSTGELQALEIAKDDLRLPWTRVANDQAALGALGAALDGARQAWPYDPARVFGGATLRVRAALAEAAANGNPTTRATRWDFHFKTPDYRSREILSDLAGELCDAWELGWQDLLGAVLEITRQKADADALTERGALRLNEVALDRAADRARFVLRDFGMRRNLLDERPDYEVVQLLTRFPDHFPGFGARDARERQALFDPAEGALPGSLLIGSTALLDAELAQAQRADAKRLTELRHKGTRTSDEETELVALVARVLTHHEERGVSGIEGAWNDYLRGVNGYRERVGLEEAIGRRSERVSLREVENGHDLRLTLDLELQRAAEEVLEAPIVPPRETSRDEKWLSDPEGAIVIVTMDGAMKVAASGPAPWSPRNTSEHPARERVFQKPDFQPPGSIFKPIVALYALEHGQTTRTESIECLASAKDTSSNDGVYKGVHCHKIWGHSSVYDSIDLTRALHVSCNVFFAHLGERFSQTELWQMAHDFGLGEPTGVVRKEGPGGFVEHTSSELLNARIGLRDRMRAANGLSVVEATPAQMARAAIGLATGRLPELRLVDAERDPDTGAWYAMDAGAVRELPYSESNFAFVRAAMRGVAGDPEGSAYKALSPRELGFNIAVKTGSADLAEYDEQDRLVKHTWVLGWVLNDRDEPVLGFVFFVRKSVVTASRSAVWLARQYFLRPEMRAVLRELGVTVSEPAHGVNE